MRTFFLYTFLLITFSLTAGNLAQAMSENLAPGTYKGYLNGSDTPFITTEGITREGALENCLKNHNSNPNSYIKCTWNGEKIYAYAPEKMEEKRSAFKAYLGKSDTPTKYITDISKSEALTFCKTLYTNNQKEHDVRCTWDGDSLTTYKAEIQKETCSSGSSYPCAKPTPDTTATDYNIYYKQLKLQLGDKLSTFSLEKLETVLTKTEKTIKKLREGSKNKLRLQALVILIKEEISNQEENINIDDLLN